MGRLPLEIEFRRAGIEVRLARRQPRQHIHPPLPSRLLGQGMRPRGPGQPSLLAGALRLLFEAGGFRIGGEGGDQRPAGGGEWRDLSQLTFEEEGRAGVLGP